MTGNKGAVERLINKIRAMGLLTEELEPLAQIALSLAKALDDDLTDSRSIAGIAKQLQTTVEALRPEVPDAGEEADDADLSAPVRHSS